MNLFFRRADFIDCTSCEKFPWSFSGTRWLENSDVAKRLILLWNPICDYIKKVSEGPSSKKPKCSSFITIQKAVQTDETVRAKLHFFVRLANMMKPFLKIFQTSAPMLPFVDAELCKLLKTIAENFIVAKKLGDSPTVAEIMSIDLENNANLIDCKYISVGLAVKDELKKLNLTDTELREFKYQCLLAYKSLIMKVKERQPEQTIEIMSNISSVSPKYIVNHPNRSIQRFEDLLLYLIDKKLVRADEEDRILTQYKEVARKIRTEKKHEAMNFAYSCNRVDDFFADLIGLNEDYKGKLKFNTLLHFVNPDRYFEVFFKLPSVKGFVNFENFNINNTIPKNIANDEVKRVCILS